MVYTVLPGRFRLEMGPDTMFVLLFGAISYIFARMLRNFRYMDGLAAMSGLRSFRTLAAVLLGVLLILIFILEGSHKSLERARTEAAAAARQEWYEIYRMADWVQTYYLDADGNETGDNVGSTFYVNQTCYNFPYNNADRIFTRGCMTC